MSCSTKKHDVFVSFRGEDTRTNFISHLYQALKDKSIGTYIDRQLDRGEDVWPALAKAIQDSHVSIVVFSESYACSKWCLEELVKILECRKQLGLVVVPVFYNVDPSDIRNQKGTYETEVLESNEDKVPKWKAALTEAANISGWDSRTHRDESHLIENVVNDILQKLHLRFSTELKGVVGNQANCRNVELLLKSCRVIGIWGMGGIGKSTIAKILFAKNFPQYDHVCFVANAKEYSMDKLFSTLLKEEVSAKNVVGSSFHMRRLSSKKVFIVLDDVAIDSLETLEYLCGEYEGQHRDSKLVITTRDKQLLVGRVDAIYEVQEWKQTESLKLFCSEAFKKSYPEKGYEILSERAVKYAGGVPLALKVFGSYLHSKGINFWESTIRKLSMYSNERIQKVLEVSYTGLHDLEKNIFLDIAFFFKEKEIDHVIRILDACGFEATSGIEVLEDKALITISNSKIIQMHDLLQQMGLEIVRQECSGDPGRHSRLKDSKAREVIEENKGTDAIQGIALDLSQIKNLTLRSDSFTKMKTLRFLRFYNTNLGQSSSNTYLHLPASLEPFSDKLRYIEWIGYPFESLPSPFCAKFLVEIRMPHSKVKQLWEGIQEVDNLEGIDLSECEHFEELPDLSKAPRLKWLNLSFCESLRYLHPSVLSSDTLVTLILNGCTKLESLKGEKRLKSLEKIIVNGCSNLEEFAVSSDLIKISQLKNRPIQTSGTSVRSNWRHNFEKYLEKLKPFDSVLPMKDFINYNPPSLQHSNMLKLDRSYMITLPEITKNFGKLKMLWSLENCNEIQYLSKLPFSINYERVNNRTLLASVPNLVNLANVMSGGTRFITYEKDLELDEHSCKLIMKRVQLIMVCAAFDNMVRKSRDLHDYVYNSVKLCLPGSRVPEEIKYRSTESFITIDLHKLSNLRGFLYYVVLSPSGEMEKHDTKIICKRFLRKNTRESWISSDIKGLNTDHVYIWYDPFHCDGILKYNEPSVCFEFGVQNDEGEVDGSMCIKECGVHVISVSELPSVLGELEWDTEKMKDLVKRVELITGQRITLTSIERSDEEENNGMRNQIGNQQRDLSEHSSFHSIVGTELDSKMVEPDSGEEDNKRKNHYSAVEEIINSTHKEVKTDSGTDCRQNTTESTKGVLQVFLYIDKHRLEQFVQFKYKGNGETPIKQGATLLETVESELGKENESKEKSRPKSTVDELESVEDNVRKDNFCGAEESTGKEIKIGAGAGSRENITKYTEDVESKGNRRTTAEHDASLHDLIIESPPNTEYNESEDNSKSVKDNRGSKDYFSGVEENIEYSARSATKTTAKRGPKEKSTKSTEIVANEHSESTSLQASSEGGSEDLHDRLEESNKQVVETHDTGKLVTKYSSLDLENCLQQLDENPFAILDLLSNELSPSLKQSETCVQKVAQANDATTILNEFRTLVFSTSLLKKLPDQSYRQQIAETLQKLHTYRREITKEQEAGLEKFIELYNKAVNISQDKMLTEDKQAKLASEKRDLYNKLQDSKLKVQQFDTTISTSKSQMENLQKRQREIQEAIKKFQQENEALEKDRSALEVLYSEKQTKKNETLESVKCLSTSVVQTTKQLEELEEKRLSLASAYKDLKEPYRRMKTKPPF